MPSLDELRTLLPDDAVALGLTAANRAAAVRLAGGLLVATDRVDEDYIAQMLDREAAVSTYVGDGIAMPHGTLTAKDDVRTDGFAVVRLADPVDWDGHPVRVVIAIAAHGRGYIALLSSLAAALLDGERAARLLEAGDPESIRRLLASS